MLLSEYISRPKGIVRPEESQQEIDQKCAKLALYQYKTCPFCIKVRQEMRRLTLNITQLDAQYTGKNRNELINQGGQAKVPCLRITTPEGNTEWLYESGEIIKYLRQNFASI